MNNHNNLMHLHQSTNNPQVVMVNNINHGLNVIHTPEYVEMSKKIQDYMKELDKSMINFLRDMANKKVINEVRLQSVLPIKYKNYEAFIISIDKTIRFYSTDNTVYQDIANCILNGVELNPCAKNGVKFGMRQKLEEIVQFFMRQDESDLEEKTKQMKAILFEINIGLSFIKQKEKELEMYREEFTKHFNAALIELANIKTAVDENNNKIRCWSQQLFGGIDRFFDAKCATFKQQICNLEIELQHSAQDDNKKFDAYTKMISCLDAHLSNVVLNFNEAIKAMENAVTQTKKPENPFARSNVIVTPNSCIQNFYIKMHNTQMPDQ